MSRPASSDAIGHRGIGFIAPDDPDDPNGPQAVVLERMARADIKQAL